MATSICEALSERRLSDAELFKRYGVFLHLTARLLGCKPAYTSYAHFSSLALNFYFGALTSCLRIPTIDLGFGTLSPSQRRLALFQSSLTHRCSYCCGHTCLMGDMLKGSQHDQVVQAGGWDNYHRQKSEQDQMIKRLVRDVCSFPARLSVATKKQFIDIFGTSGYDELTSMVSFMGWLNYEMGAMGMQLEGKAAPMASLVFHTFDPDDNIDFLAADDGDQTKGQQDVQSLRNKKHASPWYRSVAFLRNIWNLISMVPKVIRATRLEKAMFRGIPDKTEALDTFMVEHFGSLPAFMRIVDDMVLKRVLAFGSREVFAKNEQTDWTRGERFSMLYVFGRKLKNETMVDDALVMARMLKPNTCGSENANHREEDLAALPSETRKGKLELLYSDIESGRIAGDRLSAALKFVFNCAGPVSQVSDDARRQVVENVTDPRSLVDLTGIISFCGFIHRVVIFRNCATAG